MSKPKLKTAHGIARRELWNALGVRCGAARSATLAAAVRAGRGGRAAAASAGLAEHFRTARPDAWREAEHDAHGAAELSAGEMDRAFRLAGGMLSASGMRAARETLRGGVFSGGIHGTIRELRPVALHVIRTGDARPGARLAAVLTQIERNSRDLMTFGAYPLFSMLGAQAQFKFIWCAYLALVRSGAATPAATEAAFKLLLGLGREMRRVTDRYMVHNIYTAACYALFFLARSVPELREAAEWDTHAIAMLDQDFDRAWFSDGGHLERNWGYGSHTLHRMIDTYAFASRNGGLGRHGEHFAEGLRRAHRFYAATLGPGDQSPAFGDEGWDDLGRVLDEGAASGLFPAGVGRDFGVDRTRSCLMRASGVAIMRNGAGPRDAFADVTFGDFAGWHSHMDALSMDFRALGSILLQEVPRFGPYEHPLDIVWREAPAHNQVLVDAFRYDSRPCVGQDVVWHSDERMDYISAYHTAYRQVAPHGGWRTHHASADLIVRRTIVFVKEPGYLAVLDLVMHEQKQAFNRAISAWWHGPRRFRALGPDQARTEGRTACLLAWAYPESMRRIETGVDFTREESKGLLHGDREWFNLRASCWRPLPYAGCLGFFTVLYPFQGSLPAVRVRTLEMAGAPRYRAGAFEVRTPAGLDRLVLNPERLPGLRWGGAPAGFRAKVQLGNGRGESTVR